MAPETAHKHSHYPIAALGIENRDLHFLNYTVVLEGFQGTV